MYGKEAINRRLLDMELDAPATITLTVRSQPTETRARFVLIEDLIPVRAQSSSIGQLDDQVHGLRPTDSLSHLIPQLLPLNTADSI